MPTDDIHRKESRVENTDTTLQISLTDADIRTTTVNRRSFLARAVTAGSIGVGAALTAACPSGSGDGTDSDSDGEEQ